MARRAKTKKSFYKRLPKSVVYGVFALMVIIVGYVIYQSVTSGDKSTTTGTTQDGKKVNLNPATASDKQANDANKNAIVQKNESLSNNTPASVSMVITEATSTSVKGYVQNIFENGGTCTATATQGSQTYTKSSEGFQNVSYTQCAPINWPTPLGPGTWTVTLAYKSTSAQASQTKTIEVK